MPDLWSSPSTQAWKRALDAYVEAIAHRGGDKLADLDRWYREELPDAIGGRRAPHLTLPELVRLTEWKMKRGEWRARNLVLVKGNAPERVRDTSQAALALIPHPTKPISALAKLDGVGPATASAVAAAAAPTVYPFFDEHVAGQIPGLGEVAWTLGYYARYAEALRERAAALGGTWTPVLAERALWAHAESARPGA
jgi:hypothetical protein